MYDKPKVTVDLQEYLDLKARVETAEGKVLPEAFKIIMDSTPGLALEDAFKKLKEKGIVISFPRTDNANTRIVLHKDKEVLDLEAALERPYQIFFTEMMVLLNTEPQYTSTMQTIQLRLNKKGIEIFHLPGNEDLPFAKQLRKIKK